MIEEVDRGFLKFVTVNATSIPPAMFVCTAPVTIKTELEKEHFNPLDRTATVEHEITPWRYSYGEVADGFHLGKVTLIVPPAGI